MTSLTKTLVAALKEADDYLPHNAPARAKVSEALIAYKESEEFKREQFEERLRGALKTANELVDIVRELRTNQRLSDSDLILLRSAEENMAEGADYLNTVIEGYLP